MTSLYIYIQEIQEPVPAIPTFLGVFAAVMVISICLFYISKYAETLYVKRYKRPIFIHFYYIRKKITSDLKPYLISNNFYKQLDKKRKAYFEHRVVKFLETTDFGSREGLVLDDYKKMQVTMVVIQMTFGMRNYLLEYVKTIVLYPSSYYSILNKTENKGEFNPMSRALVFSWEHFDNGNLQKSNDTNLGIHEITHAIHYSAIKSNDISSEIFYDTFLELEKYLSSVEVRNEIVNSKILRKYAYTDKFEFIAVLVEVFMGNPQKLKKQFPDIYEYVMQMLNFRYFERKESKI